MITKTSSTAVQQPIGSENPLAEAGREVTEDAGHLAERAANIGLEKADQGRAQVADSVDRVAGSIRRVSTELRSEEPGVADVALTAAEQTEHIARYLRDTDARQLVRTVEDFGRRQPLLFIGGAFLVGLAASRFMRAAGVASTSTQNGRGAYAIESGGGGWQTGTSRSTSGSTLTSGRSGPTGMSGTGASGVASGTGSSGTGSTTTTSTGKSSRSGRSSAPAGSASTAGTGGASSASRSGSSSTAGRNSDEGAY
jgi:hypothetical protein